MKRWILIIVYVSIIGVCKAQKRNAVWCFGDSCLISFFYPTVPSTGLSQVKSRGSSVSINDTSGSLLFYAFTRAGMVGNTTKVYNSQHALMDNGDSIAGEGWYEELIIVPKPNSNNLFYLFSIGVTNSGSVGLYWSLIDLTYNGGLGKVTQKNIQLLNMTAIDCITAVKYGNGRDWWLIYRYWDNNLIYNNEYYKYLISPSGIAAPIIQQVGTVTHSGFTRNVFNHKGNRMAVIDAAGMIELLDFDRCTGIFSNPLVITPNVPVGNNIPLLWSGEFSPNDSLLYVSGSDSTAELVQYNLYAPNIAASADTIAVLTYAPYIGGLLKMAPDKKIYWSNAWYDGLNYNFPYPDTTYNLYNTHLSVINSPDNIGTSCNFTPFSFYLGGARTYYGLPNNPDYDLGADSGSLCDTITGTAPSPPAPKGGVLDVTYISAWQMLFVNAHNLKGKNAMLKIYDLNGRCVINTAIAKGSTPLNMTLRGDYFTTDINVSILSNGMYVAYLVTDHEALSKKFVKY